jgi:hypothetical protein
LRKNSTEGVLYQGTASVVPQADPDEFFWPLQAAENSTEGAL